MDPIVIGLLALVAALIIVNVRIILRQVSNNRIATANNKKLEALCRGLYHEYEKVKGPKWANDTICSVIHDVVSKETCI